MINAILTPLSLLIKTKFNLYKGYFLIALVVAIAVTMALMYVKINTLTSENIDLSTQVVQLEAKVDTYSNLLEAQVEENKKELERVKFEKGFHKNVEKLKAEGKDRIIGPILSNAINELSIRQGAKAKGTNTK